MELILLFYVMQDKHKINKYINSGDECIVLFRFVFMSTVNDTQRNDIYSIGVI